MNYAEYRKKGYWISSGTIESACKQITSARLKIAVARWTHSQAPLLPLKLVLHGFQ
jgi:hypothetical protein